MNSLRDTSDLDWIDSRLRGLQRVCAALLGLNLVFFALCWVAAEASRKEPRLQLGDNAAVLLTLLAAAFILLSTRFRSSILRRAIPRSAALRPTLEGLLPAYRTATRVSFALVSFAALLGPPVALVSARADYGMIVCVAGSLAMLTRWPKSVEVDRLLRGRATP